MKLTVFVVAACMFTVSLALGAEVKLKTGETMHGDISGRIVLKGKSGAKASGQYVLFNGSDVVAIDESGIKLRGHVTVASINCGSTDAEALRYSDNDGFGTAGDNCVFAVFSTGTSHHKIWDDAYKKALDPYVREEADGLRRVVGSGLVLLGRYDGKEVLPSLEVRTTGPNGGTITKTVPVGSVVQFK